MHIQLFNKSDLIDHIDSFCELYHKTFTAKISKEIIMQRYIDNPSGDLLMYVAIDEGKIVANYSAVPIYLNYKGNRVKSALSLNTMTDPKYMGRGLFIDLANHLYDELISKQYAMVVGFPNYLSNRVFNDKLDWKTIAEIPTLKLDLSYTKKIESREDIILSEMDCNLNHIHETFICFDLSTKYLKWRFKDNKEKEYNLLRIDKDNWLIFQYYNDEINITEIGFSDVNHFNDLLTSIICLGQQKKYKYITTWYKPNTTIHSCLEKRGFRLSAPIRNFGCRCFDKELSDEVYDYRNWLVMMGDDNTY